MSAGSWLQCGRGCPGRYSIFDVIYRCERCGSLLDVEHDLGALRGTTAAQWKELFEKRFASAQWPDTSGVWGKVEWVCPQLRLDSIVSLGEGRTPLLPTQALARDLGLKELWVKQCGTSHTGSFKDLGMTVLVSVVRQMVADGKPIRAVACASTGDTSAALAAYCAAAGLQAVILLPRGKISTAQLIQPIANGALVLVLDTDFDGCMQVVQDVTTDPSIYLANSMNPLRIEGQKTVAIEIAQQLGWTVPDWVVIPSGNLGNASALARGFLMLRDLGLVDRVPRIACAQSERANPLYRSFLRGFDAFEPQQARPTSATAIQIGAPVSFERAVRALRAVNGVVEQASEDELADAAARSDLRGLYACPQTAVALAALAKLVRSGVILPEHQVVVVSTAHGLKFTDFKVRYHEGELPDVISRHANPPVHVTASAAAVSQAIERHGRGRR